MPVGLLKDMLEILPGERRLLGLDIGTQTIGLAISDSRQSLATPLQTIRRTKFTRDIEQLKPVIEDYEVGGYVLGFPINMDGSEGPRAESVRHFAQEMLNYPHIFGTGPWISLWDERLSTASVERFLVKSVDMSRKKREQVIDKLAAQHILQGALDFIQASKSRA